MMSPLIKAIIKKKKFILKNVFINKKSHGLIIKLFFIYLHLNYCCTQIIYSLKKF